MFVSRARFEQMRRLYETQTAKRQEAEDKLNRQTASIHRLQSQVAHQGDEHRDSPVAIQPASGDARLRHQLALSERARKALDGQCLELHRANVLQEYELVQLRQQLTALQAASEQGVAS